MTNNFDMERLDELFHDMHKKNDADNIFEAYQKYTETNMLVYEPIKVTEVLAPNAFLIPISGEAVSQGYYNSINKWCFNNCEDEWQFLNSNPVKNKIYYTRRNDYEGKYFGNHIILTFSSLKDSALFKLTWA